MSIKEIIKVLEQERACVARQGEEWCDRDCARCDLVMDDKVILEAYDAVIALLRTHPDAQPNEPLTEELEEAIDELKHTGYQPSAFSRFEPFYEDGSEYKKAVDTVESALRKAYRRPPKEG